MLETIEKVAGKGTALCEALTSIYTICEGVKSSTMNSYELLNKRFGIDNRPDPAKIAESVEILVDNDKSLHDMLHNLRTSSKAVAWVTMMKEMNVYLEYVEAKPLSSEQYKRWFLTYGMSLDEGMAPSVAVIEKKRAAIRKGEE